MATTIIRCTAFIIIKSMILLSETCENTNTDYCQAKNNFPFGLEFQKIKFRFDVSISKVIKDTN